MGANCNPQSVFACSTDEDCLEQGEGGRCEPSEVCSFPDDACPGGRRWHDRAPIPNAGMCWGGEGESDAESGTEDDDGADGDDTTTGSTTTTSSTTNVSTTMPDDDDTAASDDDGDSTSGAKPSCDEQYGDSPDYLLCEETPESCSFNATIANTISCNDVCSMGGGTCIEAHLNEEDLCLSTGPAACDQNDFNDGICVCSRDE
jgi:hypothetical protein